MRLIALPKRRDPLLKEEKDIYKSSRLCYIIEAALEYFISIIITGAYLAKLTTSLGISDSLTGILSSFVSLGCTFQIIAVFLYRQQSVKRSVTILHAVNQLLFAFVYIIPLFPLSQSIKTVIFVVCLLLGYCISNIISAPKINWLMSLVDDDKRGRFTANKEIVSLLSGMLFSLVMGNLQDRFTAAGEERKAFIVCAITIFVLMLLHTLTLILSKEKPSAAGLKTETFKAKVKNIFSDKIIIKVIAVSVLWEMAHYIATPFYGTYQINELGFSMTFVSTLSITYSLVRVAASRFFGKYADQHSFAQMLMVCVGIAGLAYLVNCFCTPANGRIIYTLHYMLFAISMAGINSATINLIYDYVQPLYRREALAMKSAIAGTAGFLTTTLTSPLITAIQQNGNRFLGLPLYAQQVVSVFACFLCIVLVLYIKLLILPANAKAKN